MWVVYRGELRGEVGTRAGTKNLERVVVAYSKVVSNHSAGKTEERNEPPQSKIETGVCFI